MQKMGHHISRRHFLTKGLFLGASLALSGCGLAKMSSAPTPRVRVVEATRLVEKTVEVTKIVPGTGSIISITPSEEAGMIWYVDIEHEKALADPSLSPNFDRVRAERTEISGYAAGLPSESILYQQVSVDLARQKNVKAIVISGNTTDWAEYDFKTFGPLFNLVKSGEVAVIGVCGGHQLLALLFGGKCDAMRRLKPGEKDNGNFAPGWFKEVGFMPVHVVKDDPIFAGLGKDPVFFESHYWEITELPAEFEILASTDNVRATAIKHKELPIYGTQFHPEVNSAEQRDGLALLENFFRSTGIRKD